MIAESYERSRESAITDPIFSIADALSLVRDKLLTEIPLSRHLGIQVAAAEATGQLILRAPLALNVNREIGAFSGSLNAIATIAGWATVLLLLIEHDLDGHVLIQDSAVRYLRPVRTDFEAVVTPPDRKVVTRFIKALSRHEKARIELRATVMDEEGAAVEFCGRYVVFSGLAAFGADHARPMTGNGEGGPQA